MASRSVSVQTAAIAQFRAFNLPVVAFRVPTHTNDPQIRVSIVTYEVRNLTGASWLYLCNAVPSASWLHKGDGWTRVSAPARDEKALTSHLEDFFQYAYRKVS